jgi:uncharacterized membrane protein YbhN (UPF0104 family)
VGLLVGWIVREVAFEAGRYDWSSLSPSPWPLLGAAGLLLAAYLFRASLWTALVRAMDQRLRTTDGWRVFMGAQLGRYLPGKLWQIAGASVLAERYGVSRTSAATAAMVVVLVHHLVGGALALLVLRSVAESLWLAGGAVVAVAVAGLAVLASPLFPRSVRWLARVSGRASLGELTPPRPRVLLAVTPGFLLVWFAFALALWLVSVGLFPGLPPLGAADAVGAMAASAVIGFAVLIAPSGLGVREAVMVTLLEPSLGVVPAGIVAVAMRVVMTAVELSLSLWGAWPYLRDRPAPEPSSP